MRKNKVAIAARLARLFSVLYVVVGALCVTNSAAQSFNVVSKSQMEVSPVASLLKDVARESDYTIVASLGDGTKYALVYSYNTSRDLDPSFIVDLAMNEISGDSSAGYGYSLGEVTQLSSDDFFLIETLLDLVSLFAEKSESDVLGFDEDIYVIKVHESYLLLTDQEIGIGDSFVHFVHLIEQLLYVPVSQRRRVQRQIDSLAWKIQTKIRESTLASFGNAKTLEDILSRDNVDENQYALLCYLLYLESASAHDRDFVPITSQCIEKLRTTQRSSRNSENLSVSESVVGKLVSKLETLK